MTGQGSDLPEKPDFIAMDRPRLSRLRRHPAGRPDPMRPSAGRGGG